MGLRAALTQLINDKIRNKTPKVVKTEHADVEQALLDNGYTDAIETNINQVYTTKSGNVITYNLLFSKSFGVVTVNIRSVKNTGGSNVTNNSYICTWKALVSGENNPFIPKANFNPVAEVWQTPLGSFHTKLQVDDTGIKFPSGASAGYEYNGATITYPSKY